MLQPDLTGDFKSLLKDAWQRRVGFLQDPITDCYRIFHGYVEGFPGVSIDRYGDCAIINKKAPLPIADGDLVRILTGLFPFQSIVIKSHQKLDSQDGQNVRYLLGGPVPLPLKVKEHGDYYFADRDSIHSNGLFLDARPARQWIKKNASSRRVYNMFAHTGSLGVAAKLGGAREVVHIDKNRDLVDKIRFNYEFNGLVPDPRGLVIGDIYYHLPRAIKWQQKFDAIILDPPPRVPVPPRAPKHRPVGQDFATLIATCCKILDKDGWLLCIYHDFRKSHDTFDQEMIAASGGTLTPIWRGQADEDFWETDPERKTRMTAFSMVGSLGR